MVKSWLSGMRRIHKKPYSNWTPIVKLMLRRATFGCVGMMRESLVYNPMTYVMLDGDELIGWALVVKEHSNFAMFYVKKKYRCGGMGTRLATRIKKDYEDVHVQPWDDTSERFFWANQL